MPVGEQLNIPEVHLKGISRVDITQTADVLKLAPLVGLSPALLLHFEEWVAKETELEFKVLI